MSNSDFVSIIISNYNGKEHLRECLLSLMRLKYSSYEVIVVDAASNDGSPEMVEQEFPAVKLLRKEKIGIGEGKEWRNVNVFIGIFGKSKIF